MCLPTSSRHTPAIPVEGFGQFTGIRRVYGYKVPVGVVRKGHIRRLTCVSPANILTLMLKAMVLTARYSPQSEWLSRFHPTPTSCSHASTKGGRRDKGNLYYRPTGFTLTTPVLHFPDLRRNRATIGSAAYPMPRRNAACVRRVLTEVLTKQMGQKSKHSQPDRHDLAQYHAW